MPPAVLSLNYLIGQVSLAGPNPALRLARAVEVADELGAAGDSLVAHFVDEARSSGLSWSQIGGALGVSKQAVQQRFVPRGESAAAAFLESPIARQYTPRARHAISRADERARERGDIVVGTEHLLMAILDDAESLAVRVLEALGATADEIGELIAADLGPGRVRGEPMLAPRLEKALDLALREALRLGHNYIGTEHLLLGLLGESEGAAAQVLASVGITQDAAREKVVKLLEGYKRRSRRKAAKPVAGVDAVAVIVSEFADCQLACDSFKAGKLVLVELQHADQALQRRAVDMLSGVAYALGGTAELVGPHKSVVLAPAGRRATGEEMATFARGSS